jgi:predicted GNAT family acetyltransferase
MTKVNDDVDRTVEVRDLPEQGAYVISVDGAAVGRAEYVMRDERHVFTHTEVDKEYSGLGLANRLVRFALDDVRNQGGSVVPLCPFVNAYIRRHEEYGDLVDHEMTHRYREKQRSRPSDG